MLKFGTNNIGKVFAGTSTVASIYSGSNLIYQNAPQEEMLVFTAIDSNGNYQFSDSYNGTPNEYILGDPYMYIKHTTEVSPTPTSASAYNNRLVYNTSTGKWDRASYNSSTGVVTPSWVEVGVTPIYNSEMTYDRDDFDYAYIQEGNVEQSGALNNMFNHKYFNNITGAQMHAEIIGSQNVPTLSPTIGWVDIPSTYKGKPVTKVNYHAYYSGHVTSSSDSCTIMDGNNRPRFFVLGGNITELKRAAFYGYTQQTGYFGFNNRLYSAKTSSLYLQFIPNTLVEFPRSFGEVGELMFGSGSDRPGAIKFPGNGSLTIHSGATSTSSSSGGIAGNAPVIKFGADVYGLDGIVCTSNGGVLVFEHSANAQFYLHITKAKSALTVDIYTDNNDIRNYDWATQNYTVTFHTLSEYTGL